MLNYIASMRHAGSPEQLATREPRLVSLVVGCLALTLISLLHLPDPGGSRHQFLRHTEIPALIQGTGNPGEFTQPPLIALVAAMARSGGGFWLVVALLVASLALWIWATAGERTSWRGMAVAASPVVVTVGLVDLDLLPVALCALALWLLQRHRPFSAGVALGIAMGAGTMPLAVLVGVLAAEGMRRGWREVVSIALPAVFLAFQLHLPFLVADSQAVVGYYDQQISGAAGFGSPWALLSMLGLDMQHAGSYGLAAFLLVTGCFLGHLRATGRQPATEAVVGAVVIAALGCGAAFPPQSGLWALFAVVLVRPRLLELGLVALTQVAHTVWAWRLESQTLAPDQAPWLYGVVLLAHLAVMLWVMLAAAHDALSSPQPTGSLAPVTQPDSGTPEHLPWRPALLTSFLAVTLTHAAFIVIGFCSQLLETTEHAQPNFQLAHVWNRWDTRRFIEIMELGYGPASGDNTAFFPAFPLVMRALHAVGLEPVTAGMLVSYLACLVACAYLYQLARSHGLSGEHAVLYLLLFPTAVFLTAAYTEALFLAGAIPAFHHARRNQPLAAGAFAALAVGTRTVGLLLLIGVAYEMVVRAWPSRRKLLGAAGGCLIGVAPFVAYGLHLQRVRGNFFDFARAQKDGWGREFHGFRDSLQTTMATWDQDFATNWILAWRLEVVFAVLMVALVAWLMWKGWVGYALFSGLTVVVNITNTWYFSNPRIALSLFPFMLLGAAWTTGHPRRHTYLAVTLAMLAGAGGMIFTRGAWFF